jgi:hypothetical protein
MIIAFQSICRAGIELAEVLHADGVEQFELGARGS